MAIDLTKVDVPSFKIPSPKEWPAKIKKTLKEWRRVYKITKKPGKEEYLAVVKVTGLGILVIGVIGFAIFLVVELMK
jgi:protein transport protein SEC61 subunit gamma and related proteins